MENQSKIKVALVRGDSLNEWEGKLWEDLGPDFATTGFCSRKCSYNQKNLNYPIKRLPTSTDSRLKSAFDKYYSGRFQVMAGLEKELADFQIAQTAELQYYYTYQAVLAKKTNPKLKVVTTVWDNSFGRFEYNYWPRFSFPPKYWRDKIAEVIKANIAGVDLFLPVTNYSAEMLRAYNVPDNKIKIMWPALAQVKAQPESQEILKRFDLVGKEVYLMVNRLVKEKGVYDVVYGWRSYLQKKFGSKNKVLMMIGSGPERNNLHRLVTELGLDGSIKFIDQLPNPEVREFYPHAKALILASIPNTVWQEQFGYVLAESITAGCPVVSTYSGAIPEVIEDAGLLFTPGNPVSLAEALVKLEDGVLCQALKNNCQRVAKKFSGIEFKKSLTNIYHELLAL